ncbi:MAG TPA: 2-oxoacid:acceptor oxidoreductase subunit alpha [Candidatus Margulisiibacteriota bacterium]|nr:2-oxoacid:acceptor oxidoreductase subunit alpha [Candidatus Margulisiibacteriota bacterium]
MDSVTVLIGGKAGFGIDKAGSIIARILSQLSYRLYIYRDYPSLIRGGHTFSLIRISSQQIASHEEKIDFLLALDQNTLNLHSWRLKDEGAVVYDSDAVKADGLPKGFRSLGLPIASMVKEENVAEIMRNSCIIGIFCKAAGISIAILEEVFKKEIVKELEPNIRIAARGYQAAKEIISLQPLGQRKLPLLTGSEALGLGLIKGGLKTYVAYPMTPSSGILHFLAEVAQQFSLRVIHPESEIAVILMALGFSYMGERVAVGTAGGGFCLMTEGLSLAGMAELPVVLIVGQRPGPSTGLPTYTAQTELHFVLSAGQGEFARFVVAPGDAEEAYFLSALAMNMSQRYQIPSIILSDKTLAEGVYSFNDQEIEELPAEEPPLPSNALNYKRYLYTEDGVSPLAVLPSKNMVVKVNSYEHDEYGITTEDPLQSKLMQEKRLRKGESLSQALSGYRTVKVYGRRDAPITLLCWGSNKGVSVEAAERLGLRVVQPLVLAPFPSRQVLEALSGSEKIIGVENNATGQLCRLMNSYGFKIDDKILKYDGRTFSVDELEGLLKKII